MGCKRVDGGRASTRFVEIAGGKMYPESVGYAARDRRKGGRLDEKLTGFGGKTAGRERKMAEAVEMTEVKFKVDAHGLEDMERLKGLLRSPNLATAIYNAVFLVSALYDYQNRGYEFRAVKNGDVRRFRLPT